MSQCCADCGEWVDRELNDYGEAWGRCLVTGNVTKQHNGVACRAFWHREAGRPVTPALSAVPTEALVAELAGRGLGAAECKVTENGRCSPKCIFEDAQSGYPCLLSAAKNPDVPDPGKCPAILKG